MQSKRWSVAEVISSTLFGFIVATVSNAYILPLFGYRVSWRDSFSIALVFTVISIIRSYIFRRAFNRISG